MAISGNSVAGLTAGTYYVRIKATATAFACVAADVIIALSRSLTSARKTGGGSSG